LKQKTIERQAIVKCLKSAEKRTGILFSKFNLTNW